MKSNEKHRGLINIALSLAILAEAIVLITGCGKPQHVLDVEASFDKTKQERNVSEVRSAVMPLFDKYTKDMQEIPHDEIPQAVSSLPMFVIDNPCVITAYRGGTDLIIFMAGGGFENHLHRYPIRGRNFHDY